MGISSRQRELDDAVETVIQDWVVVEKFTNKEAYAAWIAWRRKELGSKMEPDSLTVPDYFPPVSVSAAKEYITALKTIRRAIQWNNGVTKLPANPSPWYGE